jgi:enterochelin esterase family protein
MIGAFIDPGVQVSDGKSIRQDEYDSLGDRYSKVIVDELLPALYKDYKISRDPDRHGIAGWSSGAIAAFTVA